MSENHFCRIIKGTATGHNIMGNSGAPFKIKISQTVMSIPKHQSNNVLVIEDGAILFPRCELENDDAKS